MDYLSIIRQVEETHKRILSDENATRLIQVGARVSWDVPDGTQTGVVDFLHTDADGRQWAFCTTDEGWAAVNTTCLLTKEHNS